MKLNTREKELIENHLNYIAKTLAIQQNLLSKTFEELETEYKDTFKNDLEQSYCNQLIENIRFGVIVRGKSFQKCRKCEPDEFGLYYSGFDSLGIPELYDRIYEIALSNFD